MRGLLTVLFVLAASAPAFAQPSLTPPMAADPSFAPRPAPPAHGVYFSEGFGALRIHDEASDHWGGAIRFRVAIGYRRKQLAFELWAGAAMAWSQHSYGSSGSYLSLTDGSPPPRDDHYDDSGAIGMLGLDVKYIKTLSRSFELYAKAGLSHADSDIGEGRGIGIGAGAQLKGKVPVIGFLFWPLFFTNLGPKCTAAVFAETGYEFYRLHGHARTTDAQMTQWTLGIAFGSDF
jgi:hypothetical protein